MTPAGSITTRIGRKVIEWRFRYVWDLDLFTPRILPRIGIEYEFTDSRPDFLVGIYEALDEDAPARELRFMVSGECGERFPKITRGFKFVNAPDPSDDRAWTRSSRLFQSLEVNRPALPTLGASPPLNFFKPNALTFE